MKNNKFNKENKLNIYPSNRLREMIDLLYEKYRQEVGRDSSSLAKPVSKSAWIVSLIEPLIIESMEAQYEA